jgi:ribosomal protein S12 methylthiotransferase accessory factor
VFPADLQCPSTPILWAKSLDLLSGNAFSVPFDYIHANFLDATISRGIPGAISTNGLASGANLVEALVHAICEVIERRATELFAPIAEDARLVDLQTIENKDLNVLIEQISNADCAVSIWDTTLPAAPSSLIACIADLHNEHVPPGYGAGCHLSPTVALARALHEAAQSRLTRITGARDDLQDDFFGPGEAIRARFLAGSNRCEPDNHVSFDAITDHATDCLMEDLSWLLDWSRTNIAGPVLATDLAEDERYRVVRVLIPHLHADLEVVPQ